MNKLFLFFLFLHPNKIIKPVFTSYETLYIATLN